MRSRTEMLTTTLEGSEYEDEMSEGADSEDDWKPTKANKGKRSAVVAPSGSSRGRKRKTSGKSAKKGRRAPTKRSRKYESDESEDDDTQSDFDVDDETQDNEPVEWNKKKKKDNDKDVVVPEDEDEDDEPLVTPKSVSKPLERKTNKVKGLPDKEGLFDLFMFKNDLTKNYKTDDDFCLWRRDGSSLLQKFVRVKEDGDNDEFIMVGNSVYSCWEERSKNEHFPVKVQIIGSRKDGKVKILSLDEIDKVALTCGDVKVENKVHLSDDDEDDDEEVEDEDEEEDEEKVDEDDEESDDE